ncbi:MAG TPA: ThiF family adenylyltransferase [Kofleriaceae bacterium]|jgi:adenylyltransferase/sulfurtransferase|nr:ThiF family adenylyltransferase [Kofleriaceae bacterium]
MTLRATIVGAGGLGGPIAMSLGAAGVELVIADHDRVELSNLHRQIQFTSVDLDRPKAACLAGAVVARGGTARGVTTRWEANTADELGGHADVVIDASDDPVTKFAVSDWAVANGRWYVIAAALRYGGNVMAGAPGVACYRCLFEEPVDAPTCADAGVLGPVVGAIGGVAAAVAVALGHGERSLAGALLVFEDLRRSPTPRIVRFAPRPGCPACARAAVSPVAMPTGVAEVP